MAPPRYVFAASLVFLACGGKIDLNATERTETRRVGTVAGSSGGSSSGGTSSSSSSSGAVGSCNGSGLAPFDLDFEDGTIGDGFTINTPSAFSIEWDEPIHGSASLRVKPSAASYLARKVKSVCAARLQLTLRASEDFLKSGGNLARFDAGSRRFSLVVQPGGSLNVFEEVYAGNAVGGNSRPPLGNLFPNDPTTVVFDVDLTTSKLTTGFKSQKGAAPTEVSDLNPLAAEPPPAITSIEIGSTPGIASSPEGLYWVDDISID
jgi:hypothetical protein